MPLTDETKTIPNHYPLGLVGNGQTCALINQNTAVEWLCFPQFDSPSVFAKLLDAAVGGSFEIKLASVPAPETVQYAQEYLKNTNVLKTVITTSQLELHVIDYFPKWEIMEGSQSHAPSELHRMIRVIKGEPEITVVFNPQLNYAQAATEVFICDPSTLKAVQDGFSCYLVSNIPPQVILNQEKIRLTLGESYFFILSNDPLGQETSLSKTKDALEKTIHYWRRWVKHCFLPTEYQTEIIRSALTLKQLIFERTGALVAAPTTSLPETFGSNRNWDYRFCWIRDSYFMVNALLKLSKFEETEAYITYLKRIVKDSPTYLKPLYTIDGNSVGPVENFPHFKGFANSQPVRIGNDATYHHQTDAYGEAILSIYPLFNDERVVRSDQDELWQVIQSLVNLAIEKFPEKDNGIWEIGGASRHYTFSKLFCWVAVDRGCDIAYTLGEEKTYRRWNIKRRLMKQEILTHAWSEKMQAFSQYYGGTELDASTLLMSSLGIIDPRDPRMVSTVEQTDKQLKRNGFVYRYTHEDEFGEPDNAFLICSFWLIDALILMGQKKRARKYFEEILQYSNHLGLFSEHLEPHTKGLTGNFPQGYTHVAIINTAMLLTH